MNSIFFETDNCTGTAYTYGQYPLYRHDFVIAYFGYQGEDDRNFVVSPDKEIKTFRSRWDTGQCVEINELSLDALPMTEIDLPFTYPISFAFKV